MIGNVIEAQFFLVLDYPAAAALSIMLMAAILVLVGVYVEAFRNGGPRCDGMPAGRSAVPASAWRRRPVRTAAARLAFVYLLIVPIATRSSFSFNDSRQVEHRLARVHPRQLAEPCSVARRGLRGVREQPQIGVVATLSRPRSAR